MSAIAHVSVDLFPVLMLVIIFINNKKHAVRDTEQYWFKALNIVMIAYFLLDIFYWSMGGKYANLPQALVWQINILYQALVGICAGAWLNYLYCRLHVSTDYKRTKRNLNIVRGVLVVYVLLVVTTPWTELMFSLDYRNKLTRGSLFFGQYLICMAVTLAGGALAVWRRSIEVSKEIKRECDYLIFFNCCTFAAVLLQARRDVWWLAAPSVAVYVLIIYTNTQNRKITTDSLTGLNNRREFDQYIRNKAKQQDDREWGMLMIDLDDFKVINDTYGHMAGDEALWKMADILKTVAGVAPNFLARYGGDEFIVIGNWENKLEAEEFIRKIQQELKNANVSSGGKFPFQISCSAGYALWSEAENCCVESLIEKADARMYENKKEKKNTNKRR